ncbi:MAG: AAA family ATPase [Prevotella sp.]|jgi:exonuclease SbcC|nr:AAA family ATPase [Prevotella sp.]
MWSLINITAENIAAFKEFNYDLTQGVTTLVFGNNMDNDSQGSNGSGKSALLEAIAIAFTGESLRKVKIDEIINDSSEEAFVKSVFHNSLSGEEFEVIRTLSRKKSQHVECHIYKNGKEINTGETKQSGFPEYNKYILEKIGLSKDDIFSNFILSKHKFQCFLSSPDKDKKEIINRFSNAIIVDDAIEALNKDLTPEVESLRQAELKVSSIEGSITAIEEQIVKAKDDEVNYKNNKSQRKKELEEAIGEKEKSIGNLNSLIRENKNRISELDGAYNSIIEIEKDENLSLEDCHNSIRSLFTQKNILGFEDWSGKSSGLSGKLTLLHAQQKDTIENIEEALAEYEKTKSELDKMRKSYEACKTTNSQEEEQLKEELGLLREKAGKAEKELGAIRQQQQQTKRRISDLENKIAGEISCPKCRHIFVLEPDVDVASTKKEVEKLKGDNQILLNQFAKKEDESRNFSIRQDQVKSKQKTLSEALEQEYEKLRRKTQEVNCLNENCQSLKEQNDSINGKVKQVEDSLNRVLDDMFDSAYNIVEKLTKECESQVTQKEIDISTYKGSISTFRRSIEELDIVKDDSLIIKLEDSLKEYEASGEKARHNKQQFENRVNELKEQEQRFLEFKTHLANSKIDALGQMTNDFLEQIGSDIRIRFSGYTVLKSGKVRDKISISLIRNGIDCGSFDKFSEGEKARVNLANILAMHKLTNVSCEDGKGLDLLVLDEIMDATDESGLSNIFEALNSLRITSLVVSHGNIAENYPHRLIVNKKNNVSFINEN